MNPSTELAGQQEAVRKNIREGAALSTAYVTMNVLATAFIGGKIFQHVPLTDEIMARTAPNLLDLMIALAGGAAGAYATASRHVSVGLVGVAIATALVPPLSSVRISSQSGEGLRDVRPAV